MIFGDPPPLVGANVVCATLGMVGDAEPGAKAIMSAAIRHCHNRQKPALLAFGMLNVDR